MKHKEVSSESKFSLDLEYKTSISIEYLLHELKIKLEPVYLPVYARAYAHDSFLVTLHIRVEKLSEPYAIWGYIFWLANTCDLPIDYTGDTPMTTQYMLMSMLMINVK